MCSLYLDYLQENILKLLSNRVTNNKISGKFAHTTVHHDFAVTLMDTPGYFCIVLNLIISGMISSENYVYISP